MQGKELTYCIHVEQIAYCLVHTHTRTVQCRIHKWTQSETNTHYALPSSLKKCIRSVSNRNVSAWMHYDQDIAEVYVSV